MKLLLVKTTDISGQNTGTVNQVDYMALTDRELEELYTRETCSDYIGAKQFKVDYLGEVYVPSIVCIEDETTQSFTNLPNFRR